MKTLFFDIETNGLPKSYNAPIEDSDNYPRIVQIAWILYNNDHEMSVNDCLVIPDFEIDEKSAEIHGFTKEVLTRDGIDIKDVLNKFYVDMKVADVLIAHNYDFDSTVTAAEYYRQGSPQVANMLMSKQNLCTMKTTTNFVKAPKDRGYGYKWPKLDELYQKLFNETFENAHNALYDIRATAKCYWKLKEQGV